MADAARRSAAAHLAQVDAGIARAPAHGGRGERRARSQAAAPARRARRRTRRGARRGLRAGGGAWRRTGGAGRRGSGAAAACLGAAATSSVPPDATSRRTSSAPTASTLPTSPPSATTVPATGDGISTVALSVITAASDLVLQHRLPDVDVPLDELRPRRRPRRRRAS